MLPQAQVHLCLVSENIAANLTPILDQRTRPAQVVLLYTAAEQARAQGLERVILSLGNVQVARVLLEEPDNAEALRRTFATQLQQHRHTKVALNASGGSRLSGLLAAEVFRAAGRTVFHVDAHSNHLVDLSAAVPQSHTLMTQLNLEQVFQVRGWAMQRQEHNVRATHRAFAQELVSNIRHYSGALANLNWLAASAGNDLRSRPIESWHMASRTFIELLDRLRDLGLALVQRNSLVFVGEAERHFMNGGWLEDYLHLTLASLREQSSGIQDISPALRLEHDDGAQYELDAALLANNRLHFIECRARKLKKGTAAGGAEAVHRLDELRTLNRVTDARTLLLSYCPLREVDVRRMQLAGIKVLQEKQLQNLHFYLQEWIAEVTV